MLRQLLAPARPTVLVVDTNERELERLTDVIESLGANVSTASSFETAKALLARATPSVLVTAARLGAFHGLHLVMRAHMRAPALPAVVITPTPDPVTERDAREFGAKYLTQPIETARFRAMVGCLLPLN
jgi:DNA-binding NtrC family response regulator